MAVFDAVRAPTELMLYDKGIELVNGDFLARRPAGRSVPVGAAEPLRNECEHFVNCIQQRTIPHTDGHEGLRVLRVLQVCQQSLQRNGEPVDVTECKNEGAYGQTEERLHS